MEKMHYRYCGVELSYASFKEYIESHGSYHQRVIRHRSGYCRVLFGYLSRLQTAGTCLESNFLRSEDRVS